MKAQFTSYDKAAESQTGKVILSLRSADNKPFPTEQYRAMFVQAGLLPEEHFSMSSFESKDKKIVQVVKIKGQFRGLALSTVRVIAENLQEFAQFCDDYKDTIAGNKPKEGEVQ